VEISSHYYGYGLYVQINHGYGLQTAYGHNSALAVSVGEKVKKGQVIAYMGNSGVSTGTHLHYEVIRNGVQVDPANFL
jgi:murein DD-endopeptidase MepM/ murein hydrolase activator NlpD